MEQHGLDYNVALLAEGVDRNSASLSYYGKHYVALLAEGVDRNLLAVERMAQPSASPSSQRAWIEITPLQHHKCRYPVALLAEGVDRNTSPPADGAELHTSPSSQRAWIEISGQRAGAG